MRSLFTKPTLGLTLGGGGARGGAHIGVFKVLADAGIRPDIVVGSSIGAFVATMYGAGFSVEKMQTVFLETNLTEVIRPARHGEGLLDTEGFEEILQNYFGDADMRDLEPKTAITATDLRGKQRVLIAEGPVVKAVLASTAVPGLFPAVVWDDYLLVDGGVLDNVPTQATYQFGAERLIAVDVSGGESGVDFALDNVRTFSTQLYRALYWLLSLSRRHDTFETFIQAQSLSYETLTKYHLAMFPPDVLIRPEMPQVGMFSMERVAEAIEAGEQAAHGALADIEKLVRRGLLPRPRISATWPSPIRVQKIAGSGSAQAKGSLP